MLVADTAEQLNEDLAAEHAVCAQADHLEGIGCRIARHADTAAAKQRNLPLQALLYGCQIAVADLGYDRMTCMIEGYLIGSACAALNTVDEEAAADLVRIAQQVVVNRNGGRRSRTLDGNRHTEAKGCVQRKMHFLYRFFY